VREAQESTSTEDMEYINDLDRSCFCLRHPGPDEKRGAVFRSEIKVPTIQMDLLADDRRSPPAKRMKWVEDFDLEPQTPGTMASPRIAAATVPR